MIKRHDLSRRIERKTDLSGPSVGHLTRQTCYENELISASQEAPMRDLQRIALAIPAVSVNIQI